MPLRLRVHHIHSSLQLILILWFLNWLTGSSDNPRCVKKNQQFSSFPVLGTWEAPLFDLVAEILQVRGYPAETITLFSAGGPTSTTIADDAAHNRNQHLNELAAGGKEVVLVVHSYRGIPGTESVKGLTRKDFALRA